MIDDDASDDHLRGLMWDELFHHARRDGMTLRQLAFAVDVNPTRAAALIDHPWFERDGRLVLIAMRKHHHLK